MPDKLAEVDHKLADLVQRTMTETDPAQYDELCTEILRVLSEREQIQKKMVAQPGDRG
jgi:hypothetical protein